MLYDVGYSEALFKVCRPFSKRTVLASYFHVRRSIEFDTRPPCVHDMSLWCVNHVDMFISCSMICPGVGTGPGCLLCFELFAAIQRGPVILSIAAAARIQLVGSQPCSVAVSLAMEIPQTIAPKCIYSIYSSKMLQTL